MGEKNASNGGKFKNKADGEVCVRVYGSYEYLYVNPAKTSAEFDTILKRNNGNYRQIFEKSLKQSISSLRCDGLKGQETKHRESRKIKDSKQQGKHNEINPSCPGTKQEAILSGSSPQSSARRMRVMKSLGLCAPAGSPFSKKSTK